MLMDRVKRERDSVGKGQISMFGGESAELMKSCDEDIKAPDVGDFPRRDKMNMEKDMLGIYLSGHPLDEHAGVISRISEDDKSYVTGKAFAAAENSSGADDSGAGEGFAYSESELKDGMKICFIGVISGRQTSFTKKGAAFARARVEDKYGGAEILVWPEPLENAAGAVDNDRVVILRGKVQMREDAAPTLIVSKVTPIEVAERWYATKSAIAATGEAS
jgi:DNA polymerase-3 subunit alpha